LIPLLFNVLAAQGWLGEAGQIHPLLMLGIPYLPLVGIGLLAADDLDGEGDIFPLLCGHVLGLSGEIQLAAAAQVQRKFIVGQRRLIPAYG
jgi:hypothetical protein